MISGNYVLSVQRHTLCVIACRKDKLVDTLNALSLRFLVAVAQHRRLQTYSKDSSGFRRNYRD